MIIFSSTFRLNGYIPVNDADSLQKALVVAILSVLGTSSAVASFLAAIIVKKGLDQLCPIVN